jgi:hypothetical protein
MKNEEFYKNLSSLLKIFNNRPNHLGKFLIENDAFNKTFIENIIKSNNLSKLKNFDHKSLLFNDYEEMDEFFSNLINVNDNENELNEKLFSYIQNEEFEKAAKLRDYMIKNSINIKL